MVNQFICKPIVKLSILIFGLVVIGAFGYFPWNYAAAYETCTLDFTPLFRITFCTPIGIMCQVAAFLCWIGGSCILFYLLHKRNH